MGWVEALGEGLFRKAYVVHIDSGTDRRGSYVALVPHRDAGPAYARRAKAEAELLSHLGSLELPFRINELVALVGEGDQPILVERFVEGMPLDYRKRGHAWEPWRIAGEVASAIHAIDPDPIRARIPCFDTRRAHALEHLSVLEGLEDPGARDAHAWALENLPPETPASLIHGDLLSQNLLYPALEPGEKPGVIDWEFAQIGDPAYDLAVVTRGVKRPFQLADGLRRFLDSYNDASPHDEVTESSLHLHELCLTAAWYREIRSQPGGAAEAEEYLNRLRAVLRRATAVP